MTVFKSVTPDPNWKNKEQVVPMCDPDAESADTVECDSLMKETRTALHAASINGYFISSSGLQISW